MAIGFDAASESHTGAAGSTSETSFTWQHNPVSTPKGILIFVWCDTSLVGHAANSVTYDGVNVPVVSAADVEDTAGEPGSVRTYFLGSGVPTTDPADVVVNRDNNAIETYAVCISVTSGNDAAIHEAGIVKLQGDGTYAVQSVTDGSPGTNSVRFAAGHSGGSNLLSPGTGSTAVFDFDTGNFTFTVVRETTAGQGARNVGFSFGTSDDRAAVHLAVKEVAAGTVVTPTTVALTLTTFAPTVTASDHKTVTPTTKALTLTTFAPTVTASDHQVVTPTTVSLALTTFAPSPNIGVGVVPTTVALTLTTFAPTVSVTENQVVTPDVVALAISTFAPTVTASDHKTVVPTTVALALTTFAPTVSTSNNQVVTPGVVALSLATFAPIVTASDHKILTPGVLALVLSTFEPTVEVATAGTVIPDPIALVITTYPPTVTYLRRATFARRRVDFLGVPFATEEELYEQIFGDTPPLSYREF